jgi:hypothetical protein
VNHFADVDSNTGPQRRSQARGTHRVERIQGSQPFDGVRCSVLDNGGKFRAGGVEPSHSRAFFEHALEDVLRKDAVFGVVDISLPSNEVLRAFRIDGVASNFDRRDIQARGNQGVPKTRCKLVVANPAQGRFDKSLGHPRKSGNQRAGFESLWRRSGSIVLVLIRLHLP